MALASFLAIMVVAMLTTPLMSLAADVSRGRDITIGSTQTLSEDAYLLGGDVNFQGQADGDVSIIAGRAEITGEISGSLNLAVGQAEIPGQVDGSLRIAGGDIDITGDIGGDLIVLGGRVQIPSRARIGGDLILAGGQVDVRGTVVGDIRGNAGRLILAGTVNGSVDVATSRIEVRSTARITGDLIYYSSDDGDISSSAEIRGTVERPSSNPWDALLDRGGMFGPILRALWSLVVGVALILVAPRVASLLAGNANRPLAALGIGFLAIWIVPIIAVVLLVTLVGFPVGLLMLVAYLVALYLSQVAAGMAIGRFILPKSWHDDSRGFSLLAMTLGVLILVGVRLIPLPWVATAIGFAVTLWGFGSIVMLFGRLGRSKQVASAPA